MSHSIKYEEEGLPPLKKILVIGNGGRENALAWALHRCTGVETVWVAPGNGGTEQHHGCNLLKIEPNKFDAFLFNVTFFNILK